MTSFGIDPGMDIVTDVRAGRLVWDALTPAYRAILQHPFILGLTDGTLPSEAFARYVEQNYLYLGSFARSLALLASRSEGGRNTEFFGQRAAFAIATERAFNAEMIDSLGLDERRVHGAEPAPVTLAYSNYILSTAALGERPEAFGAVLPCFLIYGAVGSTLAQLGSPDHRYQRWIDTYVDPNFSVGIRGALEAAERATAALPEDALVGMTRAAAIGGRYEWMFWESAWSGESWPWPEERAENQGAPLERG